MTSETRDEAPEREPGPKPRQKHVPDRSVSELVALTRAAEQLARAGHWAVSMRPLQDMRVMFSSRLPPADDGGGREADCKAAGGAETEECVMARWHEARRLLAREGSRHFAGALAIREAQIRRAGRWIGWTAAASLAFLLVRSSPGWIFWILGRDLTVGAAWTASSSTSPALARGRFERRGLFEDYPAAVVHTLDQQNPRVDIDLGAVRRVSAVTVVNRLDCCLDRTRGLVIEVSTDGSAYHAVASRDWVSPFRRWDATFRARQARYVRLAIPAKTDLAVADVRVYGR